MSGFLAPFGQKPNDQGLRQGKWTREEEEYVNCLIDEFKTGMMPLAEGTSLRTFLSKMLNCHPMRISKKFVGSNYNGKQVYARRMGNDRLSNDEVKARRAKLGDLERKFLAKIGSSKNRPQQQHQPQALMQMPTSCLPSTLSTVTASGMDLRNLIAQGSLSQLDARGHQGDFSRNVSLLDMPLNEIHSSSNHSLQDLFAELVNSNSTGSLDAFNFMMQHTSTPSLGSNHFENSKPNSRAAAAGRALLQGGLGLEEKPTPGPTSAKPLSSFTSAELAAELRKRSSLKDLMAQLGGGGGGSSFSTANNSGMSFGGHSLVSLQDTLQHAADASNANAFGSLMRDQPLELSNHAERQGSIDSLSNLAIRSRFQSMQSMGSLLDPLLDGGNFGGGGGSNNNWTAKSANNMKRNGLTANVPREGMNATLAANNLMESLGVGRVTLGSFASSVGSGLNLASLLNNDDALRRLEASAPSSLNQNFSFAQQQQQEVESNNSGSGIRNRRGSGHNASSSSTNSAENTAIARFLLQKKLLEQGNMNEYNPSTTCTSDRQQLMLNVAAGGGGSGGGMDPRMSSFLSSLQSTNDLGTAAGSQQQPDDFDTLKRKFFGGSQEGSMEQRRNKPFRTDNM